MRGVLVLAVLALAGCPMEASDDRLVVFGVEATDDERDPRPREGRPETLILDQADADALGLPSPLVRDEYGTFILHTDIEVDGDPRFEHCLAGAAVIEDDATGARVAELPAGTCLRERDHLQVKRTATS